MPQVPCPHHPDCHTCKQGGRIASSEPYFYNYTSSVRARSLLTCFQPWRLSHRTFSLIMASLNTSTNGPSIRSSYQGVINSPPPSGPAASSPTYAQWAIFSVSAPLVNAFQQDSGSKESVLKVQDTGGKLQTSTQHRLLLDH